MIQKPLLATNADLTKIRYPVLGTPKLDGIRCIVNKGAALSRNWKPIPNRHIRNTLENIFEGCEGAVDGELIVEGSFNAVSSAVMSESGRPDFTYHVFDYVNEWTGKPYNLRVEDLALLPKHDRIKLVYPEYIPDATTLFACETDYLEQGYEGVMIRSPDSPYKCGRSTVKEGYLLKIKRFTDAEAEIIGYEELMSNQNSLKQDAFGYAERSSHKDGMVPAGMLGAFTVKDSESGIIFSIGSGFDRATRQEVWKNPDSYLGKLVSYKYQASGAKDLPRFPIFRGFRHEDDLS